MDSPTLSIMKDWSALKSASAAEERAMNVFVGKKLSTEERETAEKAWDGHLKHLADIVRGIVQRDRKRGQRG